MNQNGSCEHGKAAPHYSSVMQQHGLGIHVPLYPSVLTTDEGANPPPYQQQHFGKQGHASHLSGTVELTLLVEVQVSRPLVV